MRSNVTISPKQYGSETYEVAILKGPSLHEAPETSDLSLSPV